MWYFNPYAFQGVQNSLQRYTWLEGQQEGPYDYNRGREKSSR